MTLHPVCAEEMMHLGVLDIMFRTVQQASDPYKLQVLLKVARNLSDWTKSLQAMLHQALAFQAPSILGGLVKDSSLYLQSKETSAADITDDCESESGESSLASLYWDKHFWDARVEFLLQRALQCDNDDLLVEWIGILSNMTSDDLPAGLQWIDILDDNHSKILQLLQRIIEPSESSGRSSSSNDDLRMEVIIWLGELCTSRECSSWIASTDLIEDINSVLRSSLETEGSNEMLLQILLTYQHFLIYNDTRLHVIAGYGECGRVDMTILCALTSPYFSCFFIV